MLSDDEKDRLQTLGLLEQIAKELREIRIGITLIGTMAAILFVAIAVKACGREPWFDLTKGF